MESQMTKIGTRTYSYKGYTIKWHGGSHYSYKGWEVIEKGIYGPLHPVTYTSKKDACQEVDKRIAAK